MLSCLFFIICRHRWYRWPMCEWANGTNGKMIERYMQIDWTMFVTRHTNSCFAAVGIIHELMHDILVWCEKDINVFLCALLDCEAWIWREQGTGNMKDKNKAQQTPATYSIGWIWIQYMYMICVCFTLLSAFLYVHHVQCSCVYSGVRSLSLSSQQFNSPAFMCE